MAHSYANNFVHCVFSTKDRVANISEGIRSRVWAYVMGTAEHLGIRLICIGGTADHLHMLIALPASCTLSSAVQRLKANSSRWMNEQGVMFAWQEGYAAFSVSPSQVERVKEYIRNQAEHHKRRNFEEEFLAFLKKSGVEYDPKQVFG